MLIFILVPILINCYPEYTYYYNFVNTTGTWAYHVVNVPMEWDWEYLCEGCKLIYDAVIEYGLDANYPYDSYLTMYA